MNKPLKIFIKVSLTILGVIGLLLGAFMLWAYISWSSQTEFNVEGRLGNISVPAHTLHVMCAKGELDIKNPAPIDQLNTLLPTLIETCGKNANAMLLYGTEKKAYDVLFQTSSKFSSDEQYYFVYLQKLIPEKERADLTVLVYQSVNFEETYREVIPDAFSFVPEAEESITFKDYTGDGKIDAFVSAPVVQDWGWRVFILKPDGSLSIWKTMTADLSYDGLYSLRDGVPYYDGKPVAGADQSSFEILGLTGFAKDKNKVYYYGVEAPEYDVATFALLDADDNDLVKDKNGVYAKFPYSQGWTGIPYAKIEGADPATYEVVGQQYAKDKNHAYAYDSVIEGADPATFELVPGDANNSFIWTRDENHVYYRGRVIAGADPRTFKVYNFEFGTDAKNLFFRNTLVPGADVTTFEIIHAQHPSYAKDSKQVYFGYFLEDKPIVEGADPATFTLFSKGDYDIPTGYARDKNHVFYETKLIPEADLATFEVFDEEQVTLSPKTKTTSIRTNKSFPVPIRQLSLHD